MIEHTGYLHLPETAKHVDIPQEAEQQENRGPDPESAVNLPAEGSRESLHNVPKVWFFISGITVLNGWEDVFS